MAMEQRVDPSSPRLLYSRHAHERRTLSTTATTAITSRWLRVCASEPGLTSLSPRNLTQSRPRRACHTVELRLSSGVRSMIHFGSDTDIDRIGRGVIDCTLPKSDWTHAA